MPKSDLTARKTHLKLLSTAAGGQETPKADLTVDKPKPNLHVNLKTSQSSCNCSRGQETPKADLTDPKSSTQLFSTAAGGKKCPRLI